MVKNTIRRRFVGNSYRNTNTISDMKVITRRDKMKYRKMVNQDRLQSEKNANKGNFGVNSDVKKRSDYQIQRRNGNQIQSQDEKISQEKGKDYVFLE